MPKSAFTDAYISAIHLLKTLRRSAGVTQVELARRLGKPQQFISNVERGERRLDVVEYYAFIRALEADPADVFRELITKLPARVEI
jgi:transcriptional regulator with XRE-family HTH domain